jgi:hypothetical protein
LAFKAFSSDGLSKRRRVHPVAGGGGDTRNAPRAPSAYY